MLALFISMFTLGLVTSIHCVSMCGPMVVTYAIKGEEDGPWYRKLTPNLAYQGAKITSYVLVGFLLGAIGAAFNLNGVRPYIMLVAGLFMIVMGLGMTGLAPWATRLTPRPPKFLMRWLMSLRRKANDDAAIGESTIATPIVFGLLTGLFPCAPLQAAQLAAAGTGSVTSGGFAMLAFGLGTMPLMLAFGTASSLLPVNFKKKMMTALALVIIVFGAIYLNRAAMRLGSPVTFSTVKTAFLGTPGATTPSVKNAANVKTAADGVVEVPLTISNVRFNPSVVTIPANTRVRLVVDRQEDNACSAQIAVPQLGVLADLAPNAVTSVDIPASKAGSYVLTCGMGMMSGQLVVGGSVAGGPSPLPWAILGFTGVGGALWFGRRRHELALKELSSHPGVKARAAEQKESTSTIFGFPPSQFIVVAALVAGAIALGMIFGSVGR